MEGVRPALDENITLKNFKDYYWMKAELVSFCRLTGINCTGSKGEITDRIILFLNTGRILVKPKNRSAGKQTGYDWKKEPLTLNTPITDNYSNTANVRDFFTQQIGRHFKLNVEFMNWMKSNSGKTLGDAVIEWKRLFALKKEKKGKTKIYPQFEYNTYIRDFFRENSGLQLNDGIQCWKYKKSQPGNNIYEASDLALLKQRE